MADYVLESKTVKNIAVILGVILCIVFINSVVARNRVSSSAAVTRQAAQQRAFLPGQTDSAPSSFDQIMAALRTSSTIWPEITDPTIKLRIIEQYISIYHAQGIIIEKSPLVYFGAVEQLSAQQPEMLQQPFDQILSLLAILEYDFDNGQDKDMLARQILGPEAFARNKERLGL